MKINSDLIIGDTGINLETVANHNEFKSTTLYSSSTASIGTVALTDDITKYQLVIIEWKAGQYTNQWFNQTSVITYPMKGKTYNIFGIFYNHSGNKQAYMTWTNYAISSDGKSISVPGDNSNQAGTIGVSTAYTAYGSCWGITKVIGYK